MRKLYELAGLLSIIGLLLAAAPVLGQDETASAAPKKEHSAEIKSLLEKVDQKVYSLQAAGLKDISFDIAPSMLSMMGVDNVVIHYEWKAPDKDRLTLKGDVPAGMDDMIKNQMKGLTELAVSKRFSTQFDEDDLTLTKEGAGYKLTASSQSSDRKGTQTIFIGENYLPTKMEAEEETPMGPMNVSTDVSFTQSGDKNLISGLKVSMAMGEQNLQFTYEEVGKYQVLKKISIESPMMPAPMTVEFNNVKVDQGIPDSAFEEESAGGK